MNTIHVATANGSGSDGWRCQLCAGCFVAPVGLAACPLCGGQLAPDAIGTVATIAAAIRLRHDRDTFLRAALAHLAAARDIPDDVVASLTTPAHLVPIYVPFRRVHASHAERSGAGVDGRQRGGSFQVDVCLAAGFDEREAAALEAAVAVYPIEELSAGRPIGPVLLAQVEKGIASERAERLFGERVGPDADDRTVKVSSEQYYLVPVWVWSVGVRGRPCRLLMEAGSGCIVGFAPAAPPGATRVFDRFDVLSHWAWLPALFCALLAASVDAVAVRGTLMALAGATLFGGHFASAELRRAFRHNRLRLAATLRAVRPDGRRGDPAPARRSLIAMQRMVAWMPGIYAGIAVCAQLGVTAYIAEHDAAHSGVSPEAASLLPWSPTDPNLRVSALANTDAGRDVFAGLPAFIATPASASVDAPAGRVLEVGGGGYPDLAAAVAAAAAGDTIRIAPGRYEGPRLRIDKDLTIEGRGDVTFVWHGGRGPFIRIGGRGTRVALTHLRFEAYGINTAVLGDPNQAYGELPSGTAQQVHLRDVSIDSPQASAIYSTSDGARYLIEGGHFSGAGSPIIMVNGAELVIRPYLGAPTRISSDGTSGVAHNAVGLTVSHTQRLSIDSVQWSGNPGGDVAIQGDVAAARVGRPADSGAAQRVLLVDDRGAPRHEFGPPLGVEPMRFRVERGEIHSALAGGALGKYQP